MMNTQSQKTVLITGITGMVGSHLTDYLLKSTDYKIYGLVRWRSRMENLFHLSTTIQSGERIELIQGDLKDESSLDRALRTARPDIIFHLAAQSYPKTSFDSPIETLDTNILGTSKLLEVARRITPTAIIHICSSSEVFGRVSKDQIPINEDCRFHPASPYAISKVGTDLLGRFYHEAYGLNVLTTRMFTHTGPRRGEVFAESSFAKQIALIEANIIEPRIRVGNLNSLRTWADVRDAVRAYHLLVTSKLEPGGVYNIGGDHVCSIGEMLQFLVGLSTRTDISIEIEEARLRPLDADLQIPDTTRFKEHTGWEPLIPFAKTMEDLLNYWRDMVNTHKTVLTNIK